MRTYLSQDEVAFLLGCRTGMKVYRYERFLREPGLETVLGYQAIFRVPTEDLFAGVFQKVEQTTIKRAQLLTQKLSKAKPGRLTARKLEALRAISSGSGTESIVMHELPVKRETHPCH